MFSFPCALGILCISYVLTVGHGFTPSMRQSLKSTRHSVNDLTASSLRMSSNQLVTLVENKVSKEILFKGTGKSVETGDILAVEYSAGVKGATKPFASGDKTKFIVKDGSLIRGWDIGVSSMQVGEKAKIYCASEFAYGAKGVKPVIPANADVEIEIRILACLGNQLRPESLFQKDLDIDPFIASTPEAIQEEFDEKQANRESQFEGGLVAMYWKRFTTISFGFGGSNFFASQSGEKAPWYLNPNLTFPAMITIVLAAFITVFTSGGVKEKGSLNRDLDVASISSVTFRSEAQSYFS